jgi:hypothetical protein
MPAARLTWGTQMQDDDPYRVLGIGRDAGARELKRAYRLLSLTWHPDRHAHAPDAVRMEAEQRFKEIHRAYQAVSEALRAPRADLQAPHAAPPREAGDLADAIRSAVASAALRLLVAESRHAYRRVVDVAMRVLTRAVTEGDTAFGDGLEQPLQAAMWAVGMDPSLRRSTVRVLLLATSELPYRGKGPVPEVWLSYLEPLERALRAAPIE